MSSATASSQLVPFDLEATPPEEIAPGLTFQWLFNRQAILFIATNSSRAVTDAWVGKVLSVAKDWPPEQPFFVINDFSCEECVQTPYGRARSRELMDNNLILKSINVPILQNNLTMQLSRLFVRAIQRPNFRIHLTFTCKDGL